MIISLDNVLKHHCLDEIVAFGASKRRSYMISCQDYTLQLINNREGRILVFTSCASGATATLKFGEGGCPLYSEEAFLRVEGFLERCAEICPLLLREAGFDQGYMRSKI